MAVQAACPHCHASFRLKSAASVGKKAPCPKCGEKFIIKPTRGRQADEGFAELYDDDDHPRARSRSRRAGSPAPRRSARTGNRRGRSAGKSSTNWKLPAAIAGGVLLLGGGIFAAVKLIPGGDSSSVNSTIAATTPTDPAAMTGAGEIGNPADGAANAPQQPQTFPPAVTSATSRLPEQEQPPTQPLPVVKPSSKADGEQIASASGIKPASATSIPDERSKKAELTQAEIAQIKGEMAKTRSFPFDFSLPTTSGQVVSLKDFKGKVVIVDFWGTWCPPCRAEIPHFIELHEEYQEEGLEIVGLNYERGEAKPLIDAYVAKAKIPYPCLIGDSKTQRMVPNLRGFPTTLFLDRNGTVRHRLVGLQKKSRLESIVRYLLQETDPPDPQELQSQGVKAELAAFESFDFDFKLKDARTNRTVSLEQFKGNVLIVDVWGTWCPPCRAEIPHFIKLLEEHEDEGLSIVGINYERVPAAQVKRTINNFVRKMEIPYKCVIGDNATKAKIPNLRGFPTTLFIDRKGKVRMKLVGLQSHNRLEEIVVALLKEKEE